MPPRLCSGSPEPQLPGKFGHALAVESSATATAYSTFQPFCLPSFHANSARSVEWPIFVTNHGSGASVVTARPGSPFHGSCPKAIQRPDFATVTRLPSVLTEQHLVHFRAGSPGPIRLPSTPFHTVVSFLWFVLFFHQPLLTHFAVAR